MFFFKDQDVPSVTPLWISNPGFVPNGGGVKMTTLNWVQDISPTPWKNWDFKYLKKAGVPLQILWKISIRGFVEIALGWSYWRITIKTGYQNTIWHLACLGLYLSRIGSDQSDLGIYEIRETYPSWLSCLYMCIQACTHPSMHAHYFLACLDSYLSQIVSDQRDQVI